MNLCSLPEVDDGKETLSQFPGKVAMVSEIGFPTKKHPLIPLLNSFVCSWQGVAEQFWFSNHQCRNLFCCWLYSGWLINVSFILIFVELLGAKTTTMFTLMNGVFLISIVDACELGLKSTQVGMRMQSRFESNHVYKYLQYWFFVNICMND